MSKVSFNRSRAMSIATVAAKGIHAGLYAGQLHDVEMTLGKALQGVTGEHWIKYGNAMRQWLRDYQQAILSGDELWHTPFNVFKVGNGKLPFVTFGTLPVVLCPGAGDCASFCYSLKAWRYPAAFFGMLQNSLLLGHELGCNYIARQYVKLPQDVTFRLYVDGDFSSVGDVMFWAELLRERPDIAAYGYSKSFTEILMANHKGYTMPSNYRLNLSSGHNATAHTVEVVKSLPCYRGEFVAVKAAKTATKGDIVKAHKVATGRKAFACPGLCGECTSIGHACGSDTFANMDIIIKVH